jgi:hypothetical protein
LSDRKFDFACSANNRFLFSHSGSHARSRAIPSWISIELREALLEWFLALLADAINRSALETPMSIATDVF